MSISVTGSEMYAVFTPLLLGVLALGGLVLDMTFFRNRPRAVGVFILAGMAVIAFGQFGVHLTRLAVTEDAVYAFTGQYSFDHFSVFFNYIFLLSAGVTVLVSLSKLPDGAQRGEYYILITLATVGMCMMAAAHDLLILFVGLETMSIPVYVLVGINKGDLKSGEGSIKYLLLGAFSSAILLYGMALVYGAVGSIDYQDIFNGISVLTREVQAAAFELASKDGASVSAYLEALGQAVKEQEAGVGYMSLMFGIVLVMAGFFFKVAAVPFHMWTPDVYQGAPTPVTGYMATAVKAAAFAGLLRLLLTSFLPLWGFGALYVVVYAAAVLTMTVGNVVAIAQQNLKRMLAYSSIAHAGYMLVGVTAIIAAGQYLYIGGDQAEQNTLVRAYPAARSILFYLLAYAFMNLGAFGVVAAVCREKDGGDTLAGFQGLSLKRPGLAVVMAVCMFSLAGIPPLVGFAAKFYVFQSAVNARLYILVVIGVLNSVVSAYYYLRVVVVMYMYPEEALLPEKAPAVTGAYLANVLMAVFVVALGVMPQSVLAFLDQAISIGLINIPTH